MKITVKLPEGNVLTKEYDHPVTAESIALSLKDSLRYPVISCRINNEYRGLGTLIENDCSLDLLDLSDRYANLVYQNSLTLLYIKAVHDCLAKNVKVTIANSLSKGLFTVIHVPSVSDEDCTRISKRMQELVKQNVRIDEKVLTREEAIEYFKTEKADTSRRLFESAPDLKSASICTLDDETMFMYTGPVPSCGYMNLFEIRRYRTGVLLRFPHYTAPLEVPEYHEQKILYDAFSEETQWERLMQINVVSDLNRCVKEGKARDLILLSEALHEKKIAEIADQIHASGKRIILIAGPSSSGKTSFANRLCIQLRVLGIHPLYLGTDDYFVERDETPLNEKGEKDYECLEAVDTALFASQMNDLLAGKKVDLPEYDFIEGVKKFGKRITSITKDQLIVIEGIHALNPKMSEGISDDDKFRIYISPLTQLNIDLRHRIPTTDARFFRRMIRDNRTRGNSPAHTIHSWPAVGRGENSYIFPFCEEADAFFNSQCLYELAVMKKYAEPLLAAITPDQEEYAEAQRYLQLLSYFVSLEDESAIPCNSIIREFIGGSVLV